VYDRAGPLGPPAAVRGKRARGPGRPRQARVSSVSASPLPASHVVTAPATGWKPSGVRKQRALLPYGQRGPCGSISTHSRPAGPVLTKPDEPSGRPTTGGDPAKPRCACPVSGTPATGPTSPARPGWRHDAPTLPWSGTAGIPVACALPNALRALR